MAVVQIDPTTTISDPSAYARAESKFRSLIKKGLTPGGEKYLCMALDLMHDKPFDPIGFPDGAAERSIVEIVTLQTTIKKPASISSGTAWDLHVVNMPWVGGGDAFSNVGWRGRYLYAADGAATWVFGANQVTNTGVMKSTDRDLAVPNVHGLSWCAVPTGTTTFDTAPLANLDQIGGLDLDGNYIRNKHRVIAMAAEAIDVTAPLYQQGGVTSYRMTRSLQQRPWTHCENLTAPTYPGTGGAPAAGIYRSVLPAEFVSRPPQTLSEARLLPNSATWKARDGVYQTHVLTSPGCPIQRPQAIQPIVMTTIEGVAVSGNNSQGIANALTTNSPNEVRPDGIPGVDGGVQWHLDTRMWSTTNFETSGMFFHGLGDSSVIQLTWRVAVERIPSFTPVDRELQLLARGGNNPDPKALQVYDVLRAQMPCAVPANMNPEGEWFERLANLAAGVLSKIAPVVGNALSGVVGPEAAVIGKMVGDTMSTFYRAPRPKLPPKPQHLQAKKVGAAKKVGGKPGQPQTQKKQ